MKDTVETFIPKVAFTDEFKAKFRKLTLEELEKRITEAMDDSITAGKTVVELTAEKKLIVEKIKALSSPVAMKAMEEELERVEAELSQATQSRDNTEDKQLNLETLFNHCKYYVEHLEDLLLGSDNPLQNAAFFGLIFDAKPTYEELKSGTPKLAPLFKLNEAYKDDKSMNSEHRHYSNFLA